MQWGQETSRWISIYLERESDRAAASNVALDSDIGIPHYVLKVTGGFSLYFGLLHFSTQDTSTVSTTASQFNTKILLCSGKTLIQLV